MLKEVNQSKMEIICDECKHEFLLSDVGINQELVEIRGTLVNLVYFACPKCNKIYRISIQDRRYYELVDDLEKMKKRIRKNFDSGDVQKAKRLNKSLQRKQQRLAQYVNLVNQKLNGTFTFVTSENNQKEIKYLP